MGEVNATYIIDLSQSWSNSTVTITGLNKTVGQAPIFNYQALWRGGENGSFYAFGGQPSSANRPNYTLALNTTNALWQFNPDGNGGGSWRRDESPSDPGFSSLFRPAQGLSASGAGQGFFLGGFRGDFNVTCNTGGCTNPMTSGMVQYDIGASKWSNTSVDVIPHGAVDGGDMHFVANFGEKGVLLAYGGKSAFPASSATATARGLDSVSIYDISTRQWYQQATTGASSDAVPPPRFHFCSTGIQSTNGTYEM